MDTVREKKIRACQRLALSKAWVRTYPKSGGLAYLVTRVSDEGEIFGKLHGVAESACVEQSLGWVDIDPTHEPPFETVVRASC